ncbi:MAG: hypothetical protein LBI79_06810 [Nitrososphaerota archaeon]|jgi:hypothetical protein|nr:hypothetical protein [Nitrososphaerota archaeon]
MNSTNADITTNKFEMLNYESLANALHDYEDITKRPLNDDYCCRNCEQLFDTLEAHDRHQRREHNREKKYPLERRPM